VRAIEIDKAGPVPQYQPLPDMLTQDPAEEIPAGEDRLIQDIADQATKMMRDRYPAGCPLTRRDAHPKSLGCVRAELIVERDVPEHLRHGVFARPVTYPAWIRFSNSNPDLRHDLRTDLRGMSIKLMDVPGDKLLDTERHEPTQDFLLENHPVFFSKNNEEYLGFNKAIASNRPFFYFFGGLKEKPHLALLHKLTASMSRVRSLLGVRYWSQTPYRLGPHVMKYSVIPTGPQPRAAYGLSPDYLRAQMAAQLSRGDALFDFAVQLQTDPHKMPVEDPTVLWPEDLSPFIKVATLRIPQQVFDTEARALFAEHLSFTPWHALPEHRPLGGINRARRVVYDTVSRLRHDSNHAARVEPKPETT
jgi:hypothetical protein